MLKVGISLGLASYPAAGQDLESLLMAADKNMYEDKARRRNAGAPNIASAPSPMNLSNIPWPEKTVEEKKSKKELRNSRI